MPLPFYNEWQKDPAFARLPAETKARILTDYFDEYIANDDFNALDDQKKNLIRRDFVTEHLPAYKKADEKPLLEPVEPQKSDIDRTNYDNDAAIGAMTGGAMATGGQVASTIFEADKPTVSDPNLDSAIKKGAQMAAREDKVGEERWIEAEDRANAIRKRLYELTGDHKGRTPEEVEHETGRKPQEIKAENRLKELQHIVDNKDSSSPEAGAAPAPEEPGYGEVFIKSLARGVEGLAQEVGAITRWAGDVTGNETMSRVGRETLDYWEKAQTEGWAKRDPNLYRGTFMENPSIKRAFSIATEAVPSMLLGMIVGGAAIKGLQLSEKAAVWIVGTALGALEGSGDYERAREAGKSIGEASVSGLVSTAGTAILESLAIGKLLRIGKAGKVLSKVPGAGKVGKIADKIAGKIPKTIKDLGTGIVTNGGQEVPQTVWQNLVAKMGYEPTRDLAEGVVESFIGGAGVGGVTGVTMGKINRALEKAQDAGVPEKDLEEARQELVNEIEGAAETAMPEEPGPATEIPPDQRNDVTKAYESLIASGKATPDVLREFLAGIDPNHKVAEAIRAQLGEDVAPTSELEGNLLPIPYRKEQEKPIHLKNITPTDWTYGTGEIQRPYPGQGAIGGPQVGQKQLPEPEVPQIEEQAGPPAGETPPQFKGPEGPEQFGRPRGKLPSPSGESIEMPSPDEIRRVDGKPFAKEGSVKAKIKKLGKSVEDYEIAKVDGGYIGMKRGERPRNDSHLQEMTDNIDALRTELETLDDVFAQGISKVGEERWIEAEDRANAIRKRLYELTGDHKGRTPEEVEHETGRKPQEIKAENRLKELQHIVDNKDSSSPEAGAALRYMKLAKRNRKGGYDLTAAGLKELKALKQDQEQKVKPEPRQEGTPIKEPWEMNQQEWFDYKFGQFPKEVQKQIINQEKGFVGVGEIRHQTDGEHQRNIEQALKEGKTVPESVLKDYPELVKQEEPPAKVQPWQMTQRDYQLIKARGNPPVSNANDKQKHENAVIQALNDGESVPEQVLEDYPHLQRQKAQTTTEAKRVEQQEAFSALYDYALEDKTGKQRKLAYKPVDAQEAAIIKEKTGLDVFGYVHSIDNSAIRHINNNHGNAKIEKAKGQLPVTKDDISLIPEIIGNPDEISRGKKTRRGREVIVYGKAVNGFVLYLEEQRTGKKRLATVTMYKKIAGGPRATSEVEGVAHTSETSPGPEGSTINQNEQPVKQSSTKKAADMSVDELLAELDLQTEQLEQQEAAETEPKAKKQRQWQYREKAMYGDTQVRVEGKVGNDKYHVRYDDGPRVTANAASLKPVSNKPPEETATGEYLKDRLSEVSGQEQPKPTATQKARETKDHLASAMDKFKQINAILGEKGSVGQGDKVEQSKWESIHPLLKEAWQDIINAGKTGAEFIQLTLKNLSPRGKPYIEKFIREDIGGAKDDSIQPGQSTGMGMVEPEGEVSSGLPTGSDVADVSGEPAGALQSDRGEGGAGSGLQAQPRRKGDAGAGSDLGTGEQSGVPEGHTGEKPTAGRPGKRDPGLGGEAPGKSEIPETGQNHIISDDDIIAPRGDEAKIRANTKAIQLLKRLESEDRNPSPEEKKILAQYVGWGAFSQKVFNRDFTDYLEKHSDIPATQFFTPDTLKKFENWKQKYGNKLYPGLGGLMSEEEWKSARASTLYGVEKDSISGRIFQKLYPQAHIDVTAFEKAKAGKLLFEKNELQSQEHKYRVAESAHIRQISQARRNIRELPELIEQDEQRQTKYENILSELEEAFPGLELGPVTYKGKEYDRAEFARKLGKEVDAIKEEFKETLPGMKMGDYRKMIPETSFETEIAREITANINGMSVTLTVRPDTNFLRTKKPGEKLEFRIHDHADGTREMPILQDIQANLSWKGENVDSFYTKNIAKQFTASFNRALKRVPRQIQTIKNNIAHNKKTLAEMEKIQGQGFKYAQDLQDIRQRLSEIDQELIALDREAQENERAELTGEEADERAKALPGVGNMPEGPYQEIKERLGDNYFDRITTKAGITKFLPKDDKTRILLEGSKSNGKWLLKPAFIPDKLSKRIDDQRFPYGQDQSDKAVWPKDPSVTLQYAFSVKSPINDYAFYEIPGGKFTAFPESQISYLQKNIPDFSLKMDPSDSTKALILSGEEHAGVIMALFPEHIEALLRGDNIETGLFMGDADRQTFHNLDQLEQDVATWARETLPQDALDQTELTLTPKIKLEGLKIDKTLKQWRDIDKALSKVMGAATVGPTIAKVQISYNFDNNTIQESVYHECFHVAAKWLLPDADYARLMKFYQGNEKKAAMAFQKHAMLRAQGKGNTKGRIRQIFEKIIRALTAIRTGLQGKGYFNPESVFDALLNHEYSMLPQADMQMRIFGEPQANMTSAPLRTAQERLDALLKSDVYEVDDSPFDGISDKKSIRKKALEIYRGLGIVKNRYDGKEIQFVMPGYKEMQPHSADIRTVKIVPALDTLMENAIPLFEEQQNIDDPVETAKWFQYGVKTSINNGVVYVRLTVREDKLGKRYVDYFRDAHLTEGQEIQKAIESPAGLRAMRGRDSQRPSKDKLIQWIHDVKSNPPTMLNMGKDEKPFDPIAFVNEVIARPGKPKNTYNEKIKEAETLFKRGKKAVGSRFGKGYSDRDLKMYKAAFGLPYWIGKKHESIGRAVNVEIKAAETRSKELFDDYSGPLGDVQDSIPKDKAAMKELRDLIWKWDGKRMPKAAVPDYWCKDPVDGEPLEINPDHYRQVERFLLKQGHSEKVVNAFLVIRKKLDEKWIDIEDTMKTEKIDPELITEYRSQINKIHNYFPHHRTGGSHVTIIKKGNGDEDSRTVYREHYNTLKDRALPIGKKAMARAKQWLTDQINSGELQGSVNDFSIIQGKVKQMPDEAFFQIPVEHMQQLVAEAGRNLEQKRAEYEAKRLYNKEGRSPSEALELAKKRLHSDMEHALSKAVADVFKGRGWARHAILRKGVPGHETEDIFGILFDYLSGYAGFKTKLSRAREHHNILMSVNAKKTPNEYKYLSHYVRDMLENQDKVDRAVDSLRGLLFAKYLGGVMKSGLVNLTQNVVMAGPVLSAHTKGAHIKLGKAMKDVHEALTSIPAWTGKEVEYKSITADEKRALAQMLEEGTAQDLFLRELKGNMPGVGAAKYFHKAMDKAGIFMQIAEKFNRASTGLAAYRVAVKEKGMKHDKAIEFAKGIVYDSHFLYGKANLPSSMRGTTGGKLMRAAYTFRSFTLSYLNAVAYMLANQQKAVVARSLRNILIVGGLTSIPLFKLMAQVTSWVLSMFGLGDDDDDPMTVIRSWMPNEWTKDIITYGLPGIAGVDFSGSLSIEVPRNWKDLIGVPYSLVEDTMNMRESLKSGNTYRAVSESPITPSVVRNAMRGAELYFTGQRTRGGRDINYPGQVGPKKITALEAIGKGVLGLQPTSVSKGYQSYKATRKIEDSISEKKVKWADRYANALRKKDRDEINRIRREVSQWNVQAVKERKFYKLVDLSQSVKNRLDPNNMKRIPKLMRRKAIGIANEWGGKAEVKKKRAIGGQR